MTITPGTRTYVPRDEQIDAVAVPAAPATYEVLIRSALAAQDHGWVEVAEVFLDMAAAVAERMRAAGVEGWDVRGGSTDPLRSREIPARRSRQDGRETGVVAA